MHHRFTSMSSLKYLKRLICELYSINCFFNEEIVLNINFCLFSIKLEFCNYVSVIKAWSFL